MRLLKASGRSTIVSRLRMTLFLRCTTPGSPSGPRACPLITFLVASPLFHDRSSCFEEIASGVGAFYAPTMCASAASAISLGAPESLHQSRKGDRIPCGTASIPFARTSLEIVELDSGFPVGDGKTNPVASVRWAALSMMFRAGLLRGTRCGRPVLVRSPGISHVFMVRSISSHAVL